MSMFGTVVVVVDASSVDTSFLEVVVGGGIVVVVVEVVVGGGVVVVVVVVVVGGGGSGVGGGGVVRGRGRSISQGSMNWVRRESALRDSGLAWGSCSTTEATEVQVALNCCTKVALQPAKHAESAVTRPTSVCGGL